MLKEKKFSMEMKMNLTEDLRQDNYGEGERGSGAIDSNFSSLQGGIQYDNEYIEGEHDSNENASLLTESKLEDY